MTILENKNRDSSQFYTLEEYLELEEKAVFKSEFVNGRIIPVDEIMNYTYKSNDYNHDLINKEIQSLFTSSVSILDKKVSISSYENEKVYIEKFDKSIVADILVVIGEKYNLNNEEAIMSPTLIVEVLSKSTESYDRGNKFRTYQSMPSFKEYVIVNQDMPVIEVFHKISENKWEMTSYVGLDKVITFESLDVSLKMADIYQTAIDLQNPQVFIDFPEKE